MKVIQKRVVRTKPLISTFEDYIQIMITPLVSSNSSVNIFLNENNLFTIKVHWDFAIFGTEKNPFIQGR
jgi:hypothetical protein